MIAWVLACTADRAPSRWPVRHDGEVVVRVAVDSPEDIDRLVALGADLWSEHVETEVLAAVPRSALGALPGRYEVVLPDVQAAIDATAPRLPAIDVVGFYDDWRPFDEIDAHLDQLAARVDWAQVEDVGTTVEGRTIRALVLSTPPSTPDDRLGFLITGAQHAREWVAASSALYVAERLVDGYGDDPAITAFLDANEVYVVPVANPDGYAFTWSTDRLWRKNRTDNGNGSYGIDLNRNWDAAWGGAGSSDLGTSDNYRGTAPFSEPETAAIADFADAHPRIGRYLDLHCTGELALRPWAWTPTTSPDEGPLAAGSGVARDALASLYGTPYDDGTFNTRLYPGSGVAIDWMYGRRGMWAWLFELRDRGQYGFLLPADQIVPGEEVLAGVLAVPTVPERPRMWLRTGGPLRAGDPALLIATRAVAGSTVELYRSSTGVGETVLSDGVVLELADAVRFGVDTADDHGRALFAWDVPEGRAGETGWYEARSGDQRSTVVQDEIASP